MKSSTTAIPQPPPLRTKSAKQFLKFPLTAASKFLSAYNVKSYSTKFPENFQWKCKISFPCARFINQFGYKLITEMQNYQNFDFSALCITKLENTLSELNCFFDKSFLGYSLNLVRIKIDLTVYFCSYKLKKCDVNYEINKLMHESGVEHRHLVAGFQNAWATGSRSPIFFANSRNFFHMFVRPQCTFGTKNTKNTNTGTP